jgi:hypothetical protein
MYQPLFSLTTNSMKVIFIHTPPPDFFSSPLWSVLSGIGGIAAVIAIPVTILVAIYIYRKQRQEAKADKAVKRLVYEVISDAPIANINKAVADRVKILFDDQPVQDLYLLIFRIANGGNIAIKPGDYAEPLQIFFKGNQIYSCEILATKPNNLVAEKDLKSFLMLNSESVTLSTLLLNPNESMSIKVLIAGSQRNIDVRARIADGQLVTTNELRKQQLQIEETRTHLRRRNKLFYRIAIFILSILLTVIVYYTGLLFTSPITVFVMALIFVVIVGVVPALLLPEDTR